MRGNPQGSGWTFQSVVEVARKENLCIRKAHDKELPILAELIAEAQLRDYNIDLPPRQDTSNRFLRGTYERCVRASSNPDHVVLVGAVTSSTPLHLEKGIPIDTPALVLMARYISPPSNSDGPDLCVRYRYLACNLNDPILYKGAGIIHFESKESMFMIEESYFSPAYTIHLQKRFEAAGAPPGAYLASMGQIVLGIAMITMNTRTYFLRAKLVFTPRAIDCGCFRIIKYEWFQSFTELVQKAAKERIRDPVGIFTITKSVKGSASLAQDDKPRLVVRQEPLQDSNLQGVEYKLELVVGGKRTAQGIKRPNEALSDATTAAEEAPNHIPKATGPGYPECPVETNQPEKDVSKQDVSPNNDMALQKVPITLPYMVKRRKVNELDATVSKLSTSSTIGQSSEVSLGATRPGPAKILPPKVESVKAEPAKPPPTAPKRFLLAARTRYLGKAPTGPAAKNSTHTPIRNSEEYPTSGPLGTSSGVVVGLPVVPPPVQAAEERKHQFASTSSGAPAALRSMSPMPVLRGTSMFVVKRKPDPRDVCFRNRASLEALGCGRSGRGRGQNFVLPSSIPGATSTAKTQLSAGFQSRHDRQGGGGINKLKGRGGRSAVVTVQQAPK